MSSMLPTATSTSKSSSLSSPRCSLSSAATAICLPTPPMSLAASRAKIPTGQRVSYLSLSSFVCYSPFCRASACFSVCRAARPNPEQIHPRQIWFHHRLFKPERAKLSVLPRQLLPFVLPTYFHLASHHHGLHHHQMPCHHRGLVLGPHSHRNRFSPHHLLLQNQILFELPAHGSETCQRLSR